MRGLLGRRERRQEGDIKSQRTRCFNRGSRYHLHLKGERLEGEKQCFLIPVVGGNRRDQGTGVGNGWVGEPRVAKSLLSRGGGGGGREEPDLLSLCCVSKEGVAASDKREGD